MDIKDIPDFNFYFREIKYKKNYTLLVFWNPYKKIYIIKELDIRIIIEK